MKIKIKHLLGAAKGLGYAGKDTDVDAMKKFIVDAGYDSLILNGQSVEVKSIEIQAEPKSLPVADDTDGEAENKAKAGATETKSINADDIDAKIAAAVERVTKAAGRDVTDNKRPTLHSSDIGDIRVRAADQAYYEDHCIPSGKAAFKSFQALQAFNDYVLDQVGHKVIGKTYPAIESARKRLAKDGVWHKLYAAKAYATTPDAAGGALIKEEFLPDIINNVNQYGVARRLCRVIPMNTDKISRPIKSGIHTLYYPDENVAGTASTGVTYAKSTLQAKMGVCIVQMSRQVLDDAAGSGIGLMDDTAREIARCIAYTEDQMLFNGDGSASYANVFGIIPKFASIGYGTAAGIVAGGGTTSAHTDANVISAMALLPDYARQGKPVISCTPETADRIFLRLAKAAGGVTYQEMVGFGPTLMYHGRPVITNNVMNATDSTGTNTIDFLYGDFSRCADFGDRLGVEIDVSDQSRWTAVGIDMRGIVRHDINVYDIGSATVRGPVVGLYQT